MTWVSSPSWQLLNPNTLQNPSLATEESIMNLHFHLLSQKKYPKNSTFYVFFPVIISLKKKHENLSASTPPSPPSPGLQGLGAGWQRGHVCQEVKGHGVEIQRPLVGPFHWRDPQQVLATRRHAIGPLDGREKHVVMLTMIFSRKPGDLMWWFKKIITNGDFSWSFNDSESWFHRDETIAVLWLASPWDDALVMPMSMREKFRLLIHHWETSLNIVKNKHS